MRLHANQTLFKLPRETTEPTPGSSTPFAARAHVLRGVLFSLSLAHLVFARFFLRRVHYYNEAALSPYMAAWLDVAIVTVLVFCIWWLCRRTRGGRYEAVGDIIVVALVLVAIDTLRWQGGSVFIAGRLSDWLGLSAATAHRVAIGVAAGAGLLAAPWAIRHRRRLDEAVEILVLILSPWVVIDAARTASLAATNGRTTLFSVVEDTPRPMEVRAGPRVIVALFDMLDERLAFELRPQSLRLPAFDAVAAQSFVASSAVPPAYDTNVSLPSLFVGRSLLDAHPVADGVLSIKDENGREGLWTDESTIVDDARALGARVGIVGWYHPYCELFRHRVDRCRSFEGGRIQPGLENVWAMAINNLHVLIRRYPTSNSGLFVASHLELIPKQERTAVDFVRDTTLRLTFLHIGLPHPPWINGAAGAPGDTSELAMYYGNVLRANDILAHLLSVIDSTSRAPPILIVTADHGHGDAWRYDGIMSRRIPFMVRFPDRQPVRYQAPMNTAVLRDALRALLSAKITNSRELSVWMDSTVAARRSASERGFRNVDARAQNRRVPRN